MMVRYRAGVFYSSGSRHSIRFILNPMFFSFRSMAYANQGGTAEVLKLLSLLTTSVSVAAGGRSFFIFKNPIPAP